MVIDPHAHALRRRAIAPAFSQKALRDAEPLIGRQASKLFLHFDGQYEIPAGVAPIRLPEAKTLMQQKRDGIVSKEYPSFLDLRLGFEGPIDLREVVNRFGFDFVSDLAFGRSFGLLDPIFPDERYEDTVKKSNGWIPGVLKSGSVFLYYSGYLPFAALVRPFMGTRMQNLFGKTAQDSLRYTKLANARLAERIAQEEGRKAKGNEEPERKDIFYHLLNSKDAQTGRSFTTEELQADTSLLIAAGSDAVTTTICALFFYALRDPAVWRRLVRNVRAPKLSEGIWRLTSKELAQMPYLHACVEEALRLAPPKPSSLPRTVLPGGAMIDGRFVPGGTTVGVSHYVLHRDPSVFASPNQFIPERWLADCVSKEQMAKQRKSFAPFGIGPMNCIGKPIAYLAIKMAVAELIRNLDFKLHEGKKVGGGSKRMGKGRRDEGEYQMWDWIIGYPEGPLVDVKYPHRWERRDNCYKWDGYIPREE